MARFLFSVIPAVGHINPTVSVGRELVERGHRVAWVGDPEGIGRLLPPDATVIPLGRSNTALTNDEAVARRAEARGPAAFKYLWEDFFVPLARDMLPGVTRAVEAFGPDVLVADQQTLAGALVARRRGVRWATFATTSAGLVDYLASLPGVQAWLDDLLGGLQREAGLAPVQRCDLSPHLVLVFSTRALLGDDTPLPAQCELVGPATRHRPEPTPFPWEALREGSPKVLISLGTINAERGARFYREAVEAFSALPIQVVFAAPPELVGPVPDSMVVRRYVPQLKLLTHMDAVVCHAGHNTTVEALSEGLPLVLAPIKDDQPLVAGQVVAAGAGLRVKFGRVKASRLRDAVGRVLEEPSFRENAGRIRASFEAAGGAAQAASHLEALATCGNG